MTRALRGLPLVILIAGCGSSSPPAQVSRFRAPEPARWMVTDHPLGRGELQAANVRFGREGLVLSLPQGTTNGGELQARRFAGDGQFTARLRSATSPGSISAFFLYRHDFATDSSDELDFEIPGGMPHRVIVTVWRRGKKVPVAQRTVPVGFDPAAGLHDYAFKRDGTKAMFQVDGNEVFTSQPPRPRSSRSSTRGTRPGRTRPCPPPAGRWSSTATPLRPRPDA